MRKRTLLYIVIAWFILILIEYYLLDYFIVTLLWIGLSITFLIISIIQLIKLIREYKSLSRLRILKVVTFLILFYFTYNSMIIHGLIEKVDWKIFYNKRMQIVEQIKADKFGPWESGVSQLPFQFPVLSNGGNEVGVYKNKTTHTVTINFWVYRNFFSAPSTSFVYTNDSEEIKELDAQISKDPKHNWKMQDNWYRTWGE
jgi:hypothetical protein